MSPGPGAADAVARIHVIVFSMMCLLGTNCDRGDRMRSNAVHVADDAPAPHPGGGNESGAAEATPAASASTGSPPAEAPICAPLARPPGTLRREMDAHDPYDVETTYLAVSSPDALVDAEINGVIAADLQRRRLEFEHGADEEIADSRDQEWPVTRDRVSLAIRCDEAGATRTMVSIECTSTHYLGGAYPARDHFTYNFGICAGRGAALFGLRVLCRPDLECEDTISDLVESRLSARDVEIHLDGRSEALGNFAVTRAGLRFFVDDVPHAIQSRGTVDIAFSQLSGVLRHDGWLAGLAR